MCIEEFICLQNRYMRYQITLIKALIVNLTYRDIVILKIFYILLFKNIILRRYYNDVEYYIKVIILKLLSNNYNKYIYNNSKLIVIK